MFAIVKNNFPDVVKGAYLIGAQQKWQQFADNMGSLVTS